MVRTLATLALVGVLITSLVGAGGTTALESRQAGTGTGGTATQEAANDSTATITVTGTGEASARADRALVFVSVTATGNSSSVAADRLAANVSRLRSAVTASNLTGGFRTIDFGIFEREGNGTRTFVARQSFEIEVSNTSAVGDVIDLAVDAGATEVNGVTFTLSRERRQEVRTTAIDRAVADARDQADAVAASTNLVVGEVRSVSVGDGGFTAAREAAAADGTVIDPGPVTVTTSVQITYNATSA